MRSSFEFKLQGFPAANRDASVELVNEGTGQKVQVKPYLDGSLSVRDLDPGLYQVTVKHPNAMTPVFQDRVRLFDQPSATFVPIAIDPGIFNVLGSIATLPDPVADVSPVQKAATAVKDRLAPISGKASGEVIRAADWNALVGGVADLANAVLQLCSLVAPVGHDHPKINDRVTTLQDTLNTFAQTFGKAQLQLQRQMQISILRQYADLMFALPTLNASDAEKAPLLTKLDALTANLNADTTTFTLALVAASNQALVSINQIFAPAARAPLASNDAVKQLQALAQQHASIGVQFEPLKEASHYTAIFANVQASSVRAGFSLLARG